MNHQIEILVPVVGLEIQASTQVGSVRLLTPDEAVALANLRPRLARSLLDEELDESLQHGGVAVVEDTVDEALDRISSALAIVRLFQQTFAIGETPHFGIAGEVWGVTAPYLFVGETQAASFWTRRGHHLGVGFNKTHADALASSTGYQFAASAIGHSNPSEGQRRALLGVDLASRAFLQTRPDLTILHAIMAVEVMLREDGRHAQTYLLARRSAYLLCGAPDYLCGRDRPTCPLLATSPKTQEGRAELEQYARGCTQYGQFLDWYDDRSDIAHRGLGKFPEKEERKITHWLTARFLPAILDWLAHHPDQPIADLEANIAQLPAPPVDQDGNYLI